MKSRVFAVGFGISLALLVICAAYTFLPPTSRVILLSYDPTLGGWIVHRPVGYNACILLFALLNVPAVLITWLVIGSIDSIIVLGAAMRAALILGTAGIGSVLWWMLIARWRARRALRQGVN